MSTGNRWLIALLAETRVPVTMEPLSPRRLVDIIFGEHSITCFSLLHPGSPAVDLNLYSRQHQTFRKLKSQHLSSPKEDLAPVVFPPFLLYPYVCSSQLLHSLPKLKCHQHRPLKSHPLSTCKSQISQLNAKPSLYPGGPSSTSYVICGS